MTFYNAKTLEKHFLAVTSKRQRDKVSGDGTYWTGGQCQWGGSHNLAEDCQSLASFFEKIENLKNAKRELTKVNNKSSFETKKQQLLKQTEEILDGLQVQTSYSTSIGGICIIWADFASFLEKQLDRFRSEVNSIKQGISNATYDEAKDLRKLESEEKKIKKDIEDNLRKAKNEPDEQKRKRILLLVDEDKKKLEKIFEKKKNIPLARLGDDFNVANHVQGIIDGLKEALERNNNPHAPRTPRNPTNPNNNPNSPPNHEPDINFPGARSTPNSNNDQKPFFEKYLKQILLIGGFLALFYYISNQKENNG